MRLREAAIDDRTTLLEENSFLFMERHGLRVVGEIPPGYRATWANRQKLAVAKLAKKITSQTRTEEYNTLLISDTGDRNMDDLIEVHIFGPFDNKSVKTVRGNTSGTTKKTEKAMLRVIRKLMEKAGSRFIEE